MRTKTIAFAMLLATLASLIGVIPVMADEASQPGPDPIDIGPRLRGIDPGKMQLEPASLGLARGAAVSDHGVGDPVVGLWYDDYYAEIWLAWYTVYAVTDLVEVWVMDDLSYPAGDSRNPVVVTEDQANYIAHEFTENIYPNLTEFFGTPDDHDGTYALLPGMAGLPADYYAGTKTIIMVSNVGDESYYDSTYPNYIAGFYWGLYEAYFDRNIINIDAYDWENRVGPDVARPHLYEGVVAHELQHLIHDDKDSDEETWVNEGMSMFAEFLTGYVTDEDPPFGTFEEFPENSLVWWGDQGGPEIVADYGVVYLWTLYLSEHFGGGPFIQALAANQENGVLSVDQTLADSGYDATFEDVFKDFRVACLVDSAMSFDLPFFPWGMWPGRGIDWVHPYEFKNADVNLMIEDEFGNPYEEAFDTPGAPPWGTDYIKITEPGGFKKLKFDGVDEFMTPTLWTSDGDWLYSGTGDLADNWAIFEATAGLELSILTRWDMEAEWDFGFVQVSTDGGYTWTSLDDEVYSTYNHDPSAIGKAIDNLPGLTGNQAAWVTLTYDLTPYAGQDILIGFRLITDWVYSEEGWYIDWVKIDDVVVLDGSSTDDLKELSELFPVEQDFEVTVVGIYERFGKSYYIVRDMTLNDLTEEGSGFLTGLFRNGGYAVLLVSLKVDEADATFYGEYEYDIGFPW